jgi:hypothetical protein
LSGRLEETRLAASVNAQDRARRWFINRNGVTPDDDGLVTRGKQESGRAGENDDAHAEG